MTDNRELGRIETNTGTAASLVADTAFTRIDGALSDTLVKAVTSSNAVTITQDELRFVSAIRFTDSGSSAAITATIDTDATDMGGYDVTNLTANDVTIEVSGQSATAPVVAAGETARINVTATDVRGIGGAGGGGGGAASKEIGIACSDETTPIQTGLAVVTFRMPHAMTVTAVRASLTDASGSGVITIDINEGVSSILSTKLTIDEGAKTSTTAATPAVISDGSLADDAEITIDIDTTDTGSPQLAAGLKVWLIGTAA